MDIIRRKFIFLVFSGALVLASIAALSLWGLNLGIDFTGGSLLEVEFRGNRPAAREVKSALAALNIGSVAVQPADTWGMILRFRHVDESAHQKILEVLRSYGPLTEKRFDAIGPSIGAQLKRRAALAIAAAIAAIVIYIAFAFRQVSKPVSSWKYGVVAVAALIHDVLIPTGVFAALGRFRGAEIDSLFVTALLTILGFSVHDTIVVFDRIRENLRNLKHPEPYGETVNRSVNDTMTRSILTSFTVILVLAAIFFFGGVSTQYFALALILGIIFGTYSSIFVASPLLVIWDSLTYKR